MSVKTKVKGKTKTVSRKVVTCRAPKKKAARRTARRIAAKRG